MALTFDTHDAIRRLRGKGHTETQAEGVVEFVRDATARLVTTDYLDARIEASEARLRADLYRVSLIQGGIIIGAVVALVKLL